MKLSELISVRSNIGKYSGIGDVDDLLSKHGFKGIGTGGYGSVYLHPKLNYVLKVFDYDDTAYLKYITLAKQHNSNPHFPKFRGSPVKISDIIYGIRMEPLESMSYTNDDLGLIDLLHVMANVDWKNSRDYQDNEEFYGDMLTKWPQLEAAMDIIRNFKNSGKNIGWDIGTKNTMLRGQIPVITDPVAPILNKYHK